MNHVSYRPVRKEPSAIVIAIARNLRRLRLQQELEPDVLAERTGLDPLTLQRIENGKEEASLTALWALADALDVPFAALLAEHAPGGTVVVKRENTSALGSKSFGLASRALVPFDGDKNVEFYELRLAPHHTEASKPHRPGTVEALHVAEGALEVTVGREPPHLVNTGDTIRFAADLPHSYRNLTHKPATLYLVMTYP